MSPRVTRIVLAGLIVSLSFALPSAASEKEIQQWQRDGIAAAFRDPDSNVWKAAIQNEPTIKILISMGAAASEVPKLAALLQDQDADVRWVAARALGNMGAGAAIEAKVHGLAKDRKFLQNLVYSGALDICIDGLNEVTPDTRATIKEFSERYFKSNIIMATQPLQWTPPSVARVYIMQSLTTDQILQFLLLHQGSLPKGATVAEVQYQRACRKYLDSALKEDQPPEEFRAARRILSNPLDLTVIGDVLAMGHVPNLFSLQQQQCDLMNVDYTRTNNRPFPLATFSESVYQLRLQDIALLPADEYFNELQAMAQHKIAISRQAVDADGDPVTEWHFRHDKFMEFFIAQTFLGKDNERPRKHLGDPRFRGAYFLLAVLLPPKEAKELRRMLYNYAADTSDHTVSDTFIQLLRTRKDESDR